MSLKIQQMRMSSLSQPTTQNQSQLLNYQTKCRKDAFGNNIEKGKRFKVSFSDEINTTSSRIFIDIIDVTSFKEENELSFYSDYSNENDQDESGSFKRKCFII